MIVFLVLVGVPLIEIALFVTIGGAIGLWPTLACVVLTAIIGAALFRRQGLQALRRLQAAMDRGEDPSGPLADGALLLLSGALLLTPGFFTDAVGLALLFPAVRAALVAWAGPRLAARTVVFGARGGPTPRDARASPIEADYRDVTDDPTRR
jgi:UPF0716 protein FxsA